MRVKKFVALVLCAILSLQMLSMTSFAMASEGDSISGKGVEVIFDGSAITLYQTDGATAIQMSKPSEMGYPIIGGQPVQDFITVSCAVERDISGVMGAGERMTIVSKSSSTGITRTYTLETSDLDEGVVYTTTSYQAENDVSNIEWFVDNEFELYDAEDRIWSYNGGGEGPMHYYDTLQKIDLTDSATFTRENIQDYTSAGIPVADIYIANGGITVGDASSTRREVHTPVQETSNSAQVSIKWPGELLAGGMPTVVGQSFVVVHRGDYYVGLRGYKEAMEYLGVVIPSDISDRNYDLRWESWGWGTNWTVDLIIGELDKLQAAGVKQITLDDGWYTNPGDWELKPSKFPNGDSDMLRLTDAIHAHGMTAILWWRPCDGGSSSQLYQQHPEYFVMNANGTYANLKGPGGSNVYLGYALCPASEGAIDSQTTFINRAMNVWGFDGFKADYVWSMPKCYNPSHNHPYPEDSTERQSDFYRIGYETMVRNDPDVFNLLCNCGAPQDYYSLPYMTQVITADPTSLDQTRTRVKAYKALMGDFYPITTDHNTVWYPSTIGTGAVLIERRAHIGADLAEYERWLDIANDVQLHRGRFVGDLYSYGFDPYETYVVEKDGVMHYAFYRDGNKFRPTGYPEIELKGLDPDKMYRIVDYVNDRVVATNLPGDNAVFVNKFSQYLLVKAIEISEVDPEPVDPDYGFNSVDDRDSLLTYSGHWNNDSSDDFYNGTAKYTSDVDASVEFTFFGTAVRWYGQRDTNFGTAEVYIDGELIETVSAYGSMATEQLIFEAVNLPVESHTIKIVRKTGVIDIDRIAYQPAARPATYVKVDASSEDITYVGSWDTSYNDAFYNGDAKYTHTVGDYAEFTFYGTAIRWYGQRSTNFGTADVYLDGVFMETAIPYGGGAIEYLLFERKGLEEKEHTVRIVLSMEGCDIDYFAYANENATETPSHDFVLVDAMDTSINYSGTWIDDHSNAFHAGNARYTTEAGASIEFSFVGTAIHWYGQNDTNFGTAMVYVDDDLMGTVNAYGNMAAGQLLFEKNDLPSGEHTIRVVCESPVIDIDYFSYANIT